MNSRVLVADDDEDLRATVRLALQRQGYEVVVAEDGTAALDAVARLPFAAMVLDLRMPRCDGLAVLRACRDRHVGFPILVMTAQSDVASAIEATRLGAAGYLVKPFVAETLFAALQTAFAGVERCAGGPAAAGYGRMIGTSPAMVAVFQTLRRLEAVDCPTVLVTGESGTGKDLVAQAIHENGPRAALPFMEINCAALPETLIESELFGHERGAFTDAQQLKRGLFEVAGGGVLFLDEIAELTLATQAKLLRALENRRFKRVGGVDDLPLHAAIVAATNRDPRQLVAAGRFREDLFFRLNVVPLDLPALRHRPQDLAPLALALTLRAAAEHKRPITGISPAALDALRLYPWPGNVRELRNVVERAVILKDDGAIIGVDDLPTEVRAGPLAPDHPFALPADGVDLADVERDLIEQALERTHGNQTRAAELLGISRFALRHRVRRHATVDE